MTDHRGGPRQKTTLTPTWPPPGSDLYLVLDPVFELTWPLESDIGPGMATEVTTRK